MLLPCLATHRVCALCAFRMEARHAERVSSAGVRRMVSKRQGMLRACGVTSMAGHAMSPTGEAAPEMRLYVAFVMGAHHDHQSTGGRARTSEGSLAEKLEEIGVVGAHAHREAVAAHRELQFARAQAVDAPCRGVRAQGSDTNGNPRWSGCILATEKDVKE